MPYLLVAIYGFLAASAALILEIVTGTLYFPLVYFGVPIVTLLFTALIEEGAKWIFFRQYRLRFEFDHSYALRLGLLFGLGFSGLELSLIFFGLHRVFAFWGVAGIIFLHVLTALFYSYYLFREAPRNLYKTTMLLLLMTMCHAVYNFFALR